MLVKLHSATPAIRGKVLKRRNPDASGAYSYKVECPPEIECAEGRSLRIYKSIHESYLQRAGAVPQMPRDMRQELTRRADLNIEGTNEGTYLDNTALRTMRYKEEKRKKREPAKKEGKTKQKRKRKQAVARETTVAVVAPEDSTYFKPRSWRQYFLQCASSESLF